MDTEGRGADGCLYGLDVGGTWRVRGFTPDCECREGNGSAFSLRAGQESSKMANGRGPTWSTSVIYLGAWRIQMLYYALPYTQGTDGHIALCS